MKTKKCGVYAALAAVLLITAMLLITCTDTLTPGDLAVQKDGEENIFTPPPGKALLKVIIPSESARTLLPTAPVGTVFYDVHITPSLGETGTTYGNGQKETPATRPGVGNNVWIVNPGKYDITVFAYVAASDSDNDPEGAPFASFHTKDRTINATTVNIPAAMAPIVDDDTTGIFDYAITLPAAGLAPDTATLTLTAIGIGTTVSPINLLTSGNDADELHVKSGYYRLAVKLAKKKYGTVTYMHIVHIYGNQTTEWKGANATLAMSRIAWDVTIDANGGTLTSPAAANYDHSGEGWLNGGFVDEPTGTWLPNIPAAAPAGTQIISWHTSSGGTSGNLWDFTSKKIYGNVTLFPQYDVPPSSTELTIAITAYEHPTEGTFGFGGNSTGSIAWSDDLDTPITITVSVAAPNNNGVWWYGDTSLGVSILTEAVIAGYNAGLTIPGDELLYIDLRAADKWYEFMYVTGTGPSLRSSPFTIKIGSRP